MHYQTAGRNAGMPMLDCLAQILDNVARMYNVTLSMDCVAQTLGCLAHMSNSTMVDKIWLLGDEPSGQDGGLSCPGI